MFYATALEVCYSSYVLLGKLADATQEFNGLYHGPGEISMLPYPIFEFKYRISRNTNCVCIFILL